MKCVVVGGSGFLGNAIVDELTARGDQVLVVDTNGIDSKRGGVKHVEANVLDHTAMQWVVDGADEVYHVAGMLGTSELNNNIRKAIEVNIIGAINVMEASIKAEVPRLFYPLKPNLWLNTYSITKKASEDFAALLNKEYKTKIVRLRWFNAYGPKQHVQPVRKIIPTFCLLARFRLPLDIFGTGRNMVDMVYSRDIARWSVEATKNEFCSRVYDLGRGIPLSVIRVAQDVNKIASNNAGLVHSKMRKGETEGTVLVADIEPLRAELSKRGISLEFSPWMETLEETYRYYSNLTEKEAMDVLRFHGLSTENKI